jgi:hypothetical protein
MDVLPLRTDVPGSVVAARAVAETGAVGSEVEAGMAVATNMIVSVRAEKLVRDSDYKCMASKFTCWAERFQCLGVSKANIWAEKSDAPGLVAAARAVVGTGVVG